MAATGSAAAPAAKVETYTIHPTKKYNLPEPPKTILLHGLDLLSAPIHMKNHRFFHHPQSQSPTEVIEKLKSALAEALELYPPAAGVVQPDENENPCIFIDAESSLGTPFVVETRYTPFMGETEDLAARLETVLAPGSPTLAVKVTQFSCGTMVVASSMNHQVVDLSGYLDFLELWAQLSRGEVVDFTKLPDDWTRTPGRFFSGLSGKSTVPTPPPGYKVLPAPPTEFPPLVPARITRWKFTKDAVERLKSDFSPSASDLWISSGDALSALVWGVITRARKNSNLPRSQAFGGSSLESESEILATAADGRDKSPGGKMVGKYFGNFNALPSITVSRSDLLSTTYESASRVAVEIRKAFKLQLSPEALADKISFMQDPQNTKPPGRIVWAADVVMTNWCRFNFQGPKLDFGWGEPFLATAGSGGFFPAGYVVFMQNKSSGDIFVMLTIEKEGVDALKADSLLRKYATLVIDP